MRCLRKVAPGVGMLHRFAAGSGAVHQSGLADCPCQLGYAYDTANRLKTRAGTVYAFAYHGAGDRLKQIVNEGGNYDAG